MYNGRTAIIQISLKPLTEHFNGFLFQVGEYVKDIVLVYFAEGDQNGCPVYCNYFSSIANMILVPTRRTPDFRCAFRLL